jgi:hypothetical protein
MAGILIISVLVTCIYGLCKLLRKRVKMQALMGKSVSVKPESYTKQVELNDGNETLPFKDKESKTGGEHNRYTSQAMCMVEKNNNSTMAEIQMVRNTAGDYEKDKGSRVTLLVNEGPYEEQKENKFEES